MKDYRFVRRSTQEYYLTEEEIRNTAKFLGIEITEEDSILNIAWDIFEHLNLDKFEEVDDQYDVIEIEE